MNSDIEPRVGRGIAVVGDKLNEHLYQYLTRRQWTVFKLPQNQKTYAPVNNHPDLYGCAMGNNKWVLEPNLYQALVKAYGQLDHNIFIRGHHELGSRYPTTCYYNHLVFDDVLLGNENCFDPQVIILAKESLLKTLSVKQGYIRCTTALIGKKLILTSDRGVQSVLMSQFKDYNILFVDPADILLQGFPHGFIGGCLLQAAPGEIYAYGNISKHRQFNEIERALRNESYKLIYSEDFPLEDIGSVLMLEL